MYLLLKDGDFPLPASHVRFRGFGRVGFSPGFLTKFDPGEAEFCRFAIIGHGDSWESIYQEIGHRPDACLVGA